MTTLGSESRGARLDQAGIGGEERPEALSRVAFGPTLVTLALVLVEEAFGVDQADIVGEHRRAEMVEARHVAVWLLREATDAQHAMIATGLRRRTHVMSVQGYWRVQERRKRDAAFRARTDAILATFRAAARSADLPEI